MAFLTFDSEDQEDQDRALPRIKQCTGQDGLNPQPPAGWWAVMDYSTESTPQPTETGAWFHAINHSQDWTRLFGERRHMVVRDADDRRLLVVHPDCRDYAEEMLERLNGTMVECSCGGECIHGDLQLKAGRVFAKRKWACMSIPSRLEHCEELAYRGDADDDPVAAGLALEGPEGLNRVNDTYWFFELANAR